jgi:GxxExxY protein
MRFASAVVFSAPGNQPQGRVVRVRYKPVQLSQITSEIIGAAIRIHRKLGPGLLESAYEACLAFELEKLGFRVQRQKPVPLVYEGVKLECGFRADLVVNGQVIVEIKCKEALHSVDEAQLLSHLRLLDLQVGPLINFHVVLLKDGIKRMVNQYQQPLDEELVATHEKLCR